MDKKIIARFLHRENFDQPGAEYNGTLCLVWRGTKDSNERPVFRFMHGRRKTVTTPRQFAYWLGNGCTRDHLQKINMLCSIEGCCRFSHMEPR